MTKIERIGPDLNAFKFKQDPSLLDELREVYLNLLKPIFDAPDRAHLCSGGQQIHTPMKRADNKFYMMSYGKAPLLWVSNNDKETYDIFKRYLDSLDIINEAKEHIDYDKDLVMYSGFFVIGDHMPIESWHVDYDQGANAFTLITPLFELEKNHGMLSYKDKFMINQRYSYRSDEGVFFGDGFQHMTEPYPKGDTKRVMVSLTFGTDKLKYWDILAKTIGTQSKYFILPCGHQAGTCQCLG
ncbi:hypothetical protein [Oceanicoccus sagamiensis]|uniref:Prolyl 4-hydroxylase alpha subunit Fe(2+) 2OG dioxygenase domain-containing protein n=1 Tax=Oceanicoccus sagamiensis TaxID=716816 RepID=A0A1X9N685_9GAMM|nr:hypothetical protein [Oceanicoccus sagamiensis]ARN73236.1 hypothetical protein BST96_03405 [Oceanicoccus sagamiensis]